MTDRTEYEMTADDWIAFDAVYRLLGDVSRRGKVALKDFYDAAGGVHREALAQSIEGYFLTKGATPPPGWVDAANELATVVRCWRPAKRGPTQRGSNQ